MCTSFIYRGQDQMIAMNFDNNGMKYSINTKNPSWFIVSVDGGRGKYPSFGVNSEGVFFNHLIVDSNGKGMYKRPSSKVTHLTRLISDIIRGKVLVDELGEYFSRVEITNTPDLSCHSMVCDSMSNTWIIEPGRGNLYVAAEDSKYTVMTNFSVLDSFHLNIEPKCDRYNNTIKRLKATSDLNVADAFKVLKLASQSSGDWTTEISMVYSKINKAVYYCYNGKYDEVFEHRFD